MTPLDAMELKRRIVGLWSESSHRWDRQFDWYAANMRPLMDWSCDVLGLAPGARVCDLACGTGEPALSAAKLVGPTGSVLATDLAPEMAAATERRARAMGLTNVECRVMDAEHLDVANESFDAVSFICGLMFCPTPATAVAEIHRVLRPGGRFAVAVWDDPAHNEFATLLGRAASAVLDLPPPATGAPGPFRLAARDALADVIRAGGFADFELASRPMSLTYASIDDYLSISLDLATGLRPRIDALPPSERARFEQIARGFAEPYANADGVVRLRATPLCVWGRADR